MKIYEVALIITILFTCMTFGFFIAELQLQAISDTYLAEKVQNQFWQIQGLEQQVRQYEQGDFYDVIIPPCNVESRD